MSDQSGNGTFDAAALEADLKEIRDITVIGGGPVGLAAAFWAGMREASVRIIEALPEIGGQITTLYPEKWIFDVVGHPKILARDLVEELREQALEQFNVPAHLETIAESITYEPDPEDAEKQIIRIHSNRGDILTRTIIIAGGHGAFEPKKLPNLDLGPWEGKGVHYLVSEKAALKDKHVVIVGGGDSACDWTLNLMDTAASITLVHRRNQFRAHEGTVTQIREADEAGTAKILTPHQVTEVIGDDKITAVKITGGEEEEVTVEIPCDALLLQLGFSTHLGPLAEWGFEVEKGALVVNHVMKTNVEGVWAAGDITTFEGKLKLIATGFAEAAIAVSQAVHEIRPETKIQPKYSTNTGVPGSVEGEA